MANLKISELPKVDSITNDFEFAVVDTDTATTSKVTITGMTFNNGSMGFDSLNGIADIATPLTILGDGVDFLFTGDTITVKKFQSRVSLNVTITFSADSATTSSLFYIDAATNLTPNFYLYHNTGGWTSITAVFRPILLSQGVNQIDLRMQLENGVTFNFGQVFLSAFEI